MAESEKTEPAKGESASGGKEPSASASTSATPYAKASGVKKATADKKASADKKKIEKQPLPELKPGMTVRVHQKIKEKGPKGEKERVQVFEGIILAIKHGKEKGATITVRKISERIGVEKIFPIHSPNIVKIEPLKQARVKKAKLYYLRSYKKRLKEKKIDQR